MIGEGGQGEVWEAWQSSLRRVVAVKIHRSGASDRFLREAFLTGQLDHPTIVQVLELGTLASRTDATPRAAMVMKRLRGVRWDQLVHAELPLGTVIPTRYLVRHLAILESVCQALAYAHSKGVLHLDLKPSQVIVAEFGEVYLCDWGMAAQRSPDSQSLEFVSPAEGAFGTAGFMAPEQALGDLETVGIPTDIYLLGGLVYFLATGTPPPSGATSTDRIIPARRNQMRPLDGSVPEGLRSVVETAMSANPARRYPDVESFRRALEASIQEAIQAEESARLFREAAIQPDASRGRYESLVALEQQLDRALALSPGSREASSLRDETLFAVADSAAILRLTVDPKGASFLAPSADESATLWNPSNGQPHVTDSDPLLYQTVHLIID
jgi:serine/threonine protein kinase